MPTANCIWNSFRSSAERHLLLKGAGRELISELAPEGAPLLEIGGAAECVNAALRRCAGEPGEWAVLDIQADADINSAALAALFEKKRVIAALRAEMPAETARVCSRKDVFIVDMNAPFGRIGCIIMASGLGRRFGGDKLVAPFRGRPMILHALKATEGIFAKRIMLTRSDGAAAVGRRHGVRVIEHSLPGRGDAVRLGIAQMQDMDACLFCPGDQPLLRRDTITALALAAANDRTSIWRAARGGEAGAPVLFPAWAFEELRGLPPGKGGAWLAEKYADRVRAVQVQHASELEDVDTPLDLERLEGSGV